MWSGDAHQFRRMLDTLKNGLTWRETHTAKNKVLTTMMRYDNALLQDMRIREDHVRS